MANKTIKRILRQRPFACPTLLARLIVVLALLAGCRGAGRFDHPGMDAIVARVRPLVTGPGKVYLFQLDDALHAASLVALPESHRLGRGDGRGLVRAMLDRAGKLAVSVETRDDGHAGEYGFLYRDPGVSEAELEGVIRDSEHEQRVADGWVAWAFNLD